MKGDRSREEALSGGHPPILIISGGNARVRRDMWPRRGGCCALLHLTEDNARFLLLAVVLVVYLVSGAALFRSLEHEQEEKQRQRFWNVYNKFRALHNATVNVTLLDTLLYEYGNASAAGVLHKRPRWDFAGAFHFVSTVVSTIGYGMTTPQTTAGRLLVIFYGFFGCSGAILFFNLFLERVITLLAWTMRAFHERELRRRGVLSSRNQRDSQTSLDELALDQWKPSVYWVMFYLFICASIIAGCASALYCSVEKWSFIESLYFCFVSFSTIGFGDYIASQEVYYPYMYAYRIANFILLTLGCCCIYSLFNVASIVIKQCLNSIIRRLDCRCGRRPSRPRGPRPRRNALTPYQVGRGRSNTFNAYANGERRVSGELISLPDGRNKVSLAVMQKQLCETALLQRGGAALIPPRLHEPSFTPGKVGPLAIASKLVDENT